MMRTELICQEVYDEALGIIRSKIVNKSLSEPLNCKDYAEAKAVYRRRLNKYYSASHSPKISLAKCWLLFMAIAAAILRETLNDKPNYLRLILTGLTASVLSLIYFRIFKAMPLQSVGVSFLLETRQAKQVLLDQKFDKTLRDAELTGPMGGLWFLNYDLIPAFVDPSISFYEKDSIMRAFFGLKNGVFDCVAISGLVMLLLLERKLATRLEKVRHSSLNDWFAHCFMVINRQQGNITEINTWNTDCIVLDPWYGLCISIEKIVQDSTFFTKYPLLNMENKMAIAEIKSGANPPEGYDYFLKKLSSLLHPKTKSCPLNYLSRR